MTNKTAILLLSTLVLTGVASASSFNITTGNIDSNISVNQFGENIENLESIYFEENTSTKTFNVDVNGNVSKIVDTPNTFTLFNNESNTFPIVGNVPENQDFGTYKGNISMSSLDNQSFNDSINISVNVFDNIKPEIVSTDISNVQATNGVEWTAQVEDNLNISSVTGTILREKFVNGSAVSNTTIEEQVTFQDLGSEWRYDFNSTDKIGQYYLKLTAKDYSNNTVEKVEAFEVTGLDSISVLSTNFVVETFQVKDRSTYEFIQSSENGKEFTVTLDNLSYGGNETVKLGVIPPNGESPELLQVSETRSYSESGSYELVLIHTGNNEVKGTHSVTGELTVGKPEYHVEPVNESISFSSTVKNLDKPSSTCERVKEFDSCVAYSLDSARSMFDSEYNISSGDDRSFAYLIGRIPTSDVEGSSDWGDELSLTFGEYNETITENKDQKERIKELESSIGFKNALILWMPVLFLGVGGGMAAYYVRIGQYVAFAQSKNKIIEKAGVAEPKEGLN